MDPVAKGVGPFVPGGMDASGRVAAARPATVPAARPVAAARVALLAFCGVSAGFAEARMGPRAPSSLYGRASVRPL